MAPRHFWTTGISGPGISGSEGVCPLWPGSDLWTEDLQSMCPSKVHSKSWLFLMTSKGGYFPPAFSAACLPHGSHFPGKAFFLSAWPCSFLSLFEHLLPAASVCCLPPYKRLLQMFDIFSTNMYSISTMSVAELGGMWMRSFQIWSELKINSTTLQIILTVVFLVTLPMSLSLPLVILCPYWGDRKPLKAELWISRAKNNCGCRDTESSNDWFVPPLGPLAIFLCRTTGICKVPRCLQMAALDMDSWPKVTHLVWKHRDRVSFLENSVWKGKGFWIMKPTFCSFHARPGAG